MSSMLRNNGGGHNETANLRLCFVQNSAEGSLGLHLSRTPWEPYPWVSGVQEKSRAHVAGICVGDFLLEVNGEDVLGQRVATVADKIRQLPSERSPNGGSDGEATNVRLLFWNSGADQQSLNPMSLQRFATCLQNISKLLECPVCLEVIKSPAWQCCHGHLLCGTCRSRSSRCPICRVTLGPRGRCLIAENLFQQLADSFACEDRRRLKNDAHHLKSDKLTAHDKDKCAQQFPKDTANVHGVHGGGGGGAVIEVVHTSGADTKKPLGKLNCPVGSLCTRMTGPNDILVHLQREHRKPLIQYYCLRGEEVTVRLNDKSLTCVTLLEGSDMHIFFVSKLRSADARTAFCWLWYLGGSTAGVYDYELACRRTKRRWHGQTSSLVVTADNVLKGKQFATFEANIECLLLKIIE